MLIRIPRGWEIPEREATPEGLFLGRRRLLRAPTASRPHRPQSSLPIIRAPGRRQAAYGPAGSVPSAARAPARASSRRLDSSDQPGRSSVTTPSPSTMKLSGTVTSSPA